MQKTNKVANFFIGTKRMLAVDFRRMLKTPLFYIVILGSIIVPILILTMTSFMGGEEKMFSNAFQMIGSVGSSSSQGMMDITSMLNINMLYFILGAFGCVFIGEDFRSGYYKNIFVTRSKKGDYVLSKTLVITFWGALMVLGFFIGSMIGGGIAGLSFDLGNLNAYNVIMCLLSKMFLISMFAAISTLLSVFAKSRVWLSVILVLVIGMFLFMIIPMVSPLSSTIVNALASLLGGILLSFGIGVGSSFVLKKIDLAR